MKRTVAFVAGYAAGYLAARHVHHAVLDHRANTALRAWAEGVGR
ncbi:MAG: hypothetical protein ACOYY2_03030 [Actinomycetota bacterium]